MKKVKSCGLCCIEQSVSKRQLCVDCLKFRSFILHFGKDILLNFINSHQFGKLPSAIVEATAPSLGQSNPPIYNNQF
jgi:hypothetical protein